MWTSLVNWIGAWDDNDDDDGDDGGDDGGYLVMKLSSHEGYLSMKLI